MQTILRDFFLYYKLETFVSYVLYITPYLYVIKNFKKFRTYFEFLKFSIFIF